MTTAIAKREVKYVVHIEKVNPTDKDEETKQFILNEKEGQLLFITLQSPNCPAFIPIRGNLYNRFKIAKIEIVNPLSEKALAQKEADRRYYAEAEKIRLDKIAKAKKQVELYS